MNKSADLLTHYSFWVNGETLSGWKLVSSKPSTPASFTETNSPDSLPEEISLQLPQYRQAPEVDLRVNSSNLKTIYQILLHGSQATKDTCDFSDVDVLVVLDDSRAFLPREHTIAIFELRALLRKIFLYDCLMHHGLMFMLRSQFEAYEESFLPIKTLRKAVVLQGPPEVSLRRCETDPVRVKRRLQSSAGSLKNRLERHDYERNDYKLKSVLSGLLLMPSLLLESEGIFCYKRDSFALGPQTFPTMNWSAISFAEELRLRWKRPPTRAVQKIVSKISHPHTIIRLSRAFPPRLNVERLLCGRGDEFARGCQEFLECLLDR